MPLLELLLIVMVILLVSIRIVGPGTRLAVFRFGRLRRIAGPGVVFVVPFLERCEKVRLRDHIPEWQTFSKEALEERVRKYVLFKR